MKVGNRALEIVGKQDRMAEAIFKATQSKQKPPKAKHVDFIIADTWNNMGSSAVFTVIMSRQSEKGIVNFKCAGILFRIMRSGHKQVMKDCSIRKSYFEEMRVVSEIKGTAYGGYSHSYFSYLLNKINFYDKYPEVSGNFSVQKFQEDGLSSYDTVRLLKLGDAVSKMIKSLLSFVKRLLSDNEYDEVKYWGMIPFIQECESLLQFFEFIIQHMIENKNTSDELATLITRYYDLYPSIRSFFASCAGAYYFRDNLEVPSLPEQPPIFTIPSSPRSVDTETRPKKKKISRAKRRSRSQNTFEALQRQEYFQNQSENGFSPNNPFTPTTSHNNNSSNFLFSELISPRVDSSYQNSNNIIFDLPVAPTPQINTPPVEHHNDRAKDLFSNMLLNLGTPSHNTVKVEKPVAKPVPVKSPRIENHSDLYYEKRIMELRTILSNLQDENAELKALLNQKESNFQEVQTQVASRLERQKSLYQDTQSQLQDKLEQLMRDHELEKQKLIRNQIMLAKRVFETALKKFNSPDFPGNVNVNSEDVNHSAEQLLSKSKQLLLELGSNGEVASACHDVARWISSFLDDAKGAITISENNTLKQDIYQTTKDGCAALSDLFDSCIELVGTIQFNPNDVSRIKGYLSTLTEKITRALQLINNSIGF
eukprot:TRINITY_DN5630_c0_g1_i1.p1 TRINITY_DN5630_c0_g1~~TRINITY_DN5630_c0_g1_i1.p1  ORF type:complete len:651 (-),score=114.95 TRINITY_DN5630_c0_g1_i1:770-2722(-)